VVVEPDGLLQRALQDGGAEAGAGRQELGRLQRYGHGRSVAHTGQADDLVDVVQREDVFRGLVVG
jgi:hypothetical protein